MLVRLGYVTERQVRRALCMQLNVEFIELSPDLLDLEELIRALPHATLRGLRPVRL